jgi:hypothetical protein
MNKLTVLILASLLANVAQATERYQTTAGASALSQAGALAGANAQTGNVGVNNTIQAGDYGDLRIVPPAIAPNVNTSVICPMIVPGSKAASVFFFSGSGTHAPDIVPLCVAWHMGQTDVVERMTCAASKEYAKANPNCAVK